MTADANLSSALSRTSSARILVAEDEADIRELLVWLLESYGHEVEAVRDGQAAVEASQTTVFRVAILDVTMPRLDGLAAARIMQLAQSSLNIVFHTAMEESWVRHRYAGPNTYFRRPLEFDAFRLSIGRLTQ